MLGGKAILDAEGGPAPAAPSRPTERSREVLALLADGLTAGEVAERLGISKETADTHRRSLMRKLGLRNKAELIRYAIEHEVGPAAPRRPPG